MTPDEGDLSVDADVVVVGSGASGAVVAAELARAGQDVVVLEEGAHVSPGTYGRMRPSEQMRAMWRDAGLTFAVGLGDSPMINVMMGRCVGGSSVLTGGVCFRLPEAVLETWRRVHGLSPLTPRALEPCFEEVERRVKVQEVPAAMCSRSSTLYAEGAARLGYAMKPVRRNVEGCRGFGRCNFGCPHGAKLSVDVSYLPEALRHGARLFPRCLVEKILTRGDRAAGVTGRVLNGPGGRRGGRLSVRARRVVVAAGAVHSPLLLRASGVGRRSDQVGRNLTLHPGFRVMARFDEPVQGWRGALQGLYSDAFEKERLTLVGMFTPPGVLAANLPGAGPAFTERAAAIPHLGVFGGMVHDAAGGRVRRALGREPLITYRMSPEDRHAAARVIRLMAETWFAAGAREVFLPVLGMGGVTPDALRTFDLDRLPAKKLECSSQHPLGTCRMGADPRASVVDPDNQAWDMRELYVVDGSTVPTSLGVNPQLSIMALATRAAWTLRERPLAA